jgi:drug/metabolite transporter (DMT)-like permease
VLTSLLAYFFLGEAMGIRQIAGIAVGILAIILLAH